MATQMTLGELIWKIEGDTSGFDRSLNKTEKSAGRARGILGKLAIAAGVVGAAFVAMGKKALGNAAELEQNEVALTTMLKSADKAKQVLKEFREFGAATPFETTEIIKAGKQLIAFGVSADEVTNTLRRIGDVAAGIGAPLGELSEIYGKILVSNTVYNEDLNQLAGRGIPIFQELAKVTGRNASEIKKLSSEGKITAKEIELAFKNMTNAGGTFAGLMKAQSQTLSGVWSTLKSQVDEAFTSMGNQMTGSAKVLVKAFSTSMEAGGALNEAFGALGKVGGMVAKLLAKAFIGLFTIVNKVRAFFSKRQNEIIEQQKDYFRSMVDTTRKMSDEETKRRLIAQGYTKEAKQFVALENKRLEQGKKTTAILNQNKKLAKLMNELDEENSKSKNKINNNIKKANTLTSKLNALTKKTTKNTKDQKTETDKLIDKLKEIGSTAEDVIGRVTSVFDSISNLVAATSENRIEALDKQMQKELEAAGVAEETDKERAQRELEEARATGDAKAENEAKIELERFKIQEKFAKKRAQIEYEVAMMNWGFQLATAIATAPLTVLNAVTAGFKFGPVVAGIYGALAAAAAGVQIAAVAASKPKPPSFQTGGIVPGGQTAGDSVSAQLNSGELVLNSAQQRRLFNIADGRANENGPGKIMIYIGSNLIYDDMYKASKNGDLLIDTRSVVSR